MIFRLFLLLVLSPVFTLAQTKSKLKTASVSIFKNGNAFFLKNGNVATDNNSFLLKGEQIPKARFGTLWFSSKDSQLKSITSFTDSISKSVNIAAKDIPELLALNVGLRADLVIEDRMISGEIKAVQTEDGKPKLVHFLSSEQKWLSFNPDLVTSVQFQSQPKTAQLEEIKTSSSVIVLSFTKSNPFLEMMYLQKGLSWKPFYYLEMTGNKKARLSLRSEIINDAENLHNVDINLVVGYPNFKFTGKLTSLVKFQKLLDPMTEVQDRSRYSYSVIEEVIVESDRSSFKNELVGENVEDYYFYPLKNITLPKYGRAHYELFSTEIQYSDVYECNLVNQIDYDNLYSNTNTNRQANKVFHSIKIKNNSNNPFTQAPVFIIKTVNNSSKPLSQDLIQFTPKEASTLVKIAQTPEVEVTNNEIITEKDENPVEFWGRNYYRAKVKGKIFVTNYKSKSIVLEIRNKIQGNLTNTNVPWKILWQKPQSSPNDLNFVQWSIDLKSGEEKEVEYQFEVFLNR